ncbi:MAG: efflux RND transporter permease subunit [Gallionella sp.]|nr:efflux RND transporter permease subunit [Gallionella sp.]MDD4946600.1 efflux RND transporter permease subunit [Gallionella sp.]MDD5612382.1 efflux RND transporter permease subunit [Gallionella sp.]
MKDFNLSGWALKHQALVLYTLFALMLAGAFSYTQLSQKEDPDFTFRVMTIKLLWPGATAREMEQQVTDRIERKLQETPWLDNVSSYSKAGEAVIFVTLKDAMPPAELEHSWSEVRKELSDLHRRMPEGVEEPIINDNFGETFGSIYALTSDKMGNAELVQIASKVREELLRVENVSKVKLLGAQHEKIYIEFSSRKMAALGINPLQVAAALKAQNAMEPAGQITTHYGSTPLRVSGDFKSVESIRDIGIKAADKVYRLGDICKVYRSYADPASFKLRTMGHDAVGLAISMAPEGNITKLGQQLDRELSRIKKELPAGVEVHQVSNQPAVVKKSISDFMRALLEALVIVLAVSFASLGLRAGLVVGLSIPLVLAGTFLLMQVFDIDLQRVSLGALIIALGLLVDDAMIAVEMMTVKLEQGWSKLHAATFAYTSTAFPMLTGTLITAAAFLPVGLAKSSAGEYTFSICAVVTIALLVSWFVAVIFTPFIGIHLLHDNGLHAPSEDHYRQGFYAKFRRLVELCLDYKKSVVMLTVLAFVLALAGFDKVEQEFFPPSERPELLMDIWLPEGSNFSTTEGIVREVEKKLSNDRDIVNYTSYIGDSTPRFYLPLDLNLPSVNYAQIVITARDLAAREVVLKRLRKVISDTYPDSGLRIARLENGPPVGYPVQFRIVGADPEKLYGIAAEVADIVKKTPNTKNVSLDSNEKISTLSVDVNQEKARQHGLSSQAVSRNLQALLSGLPITSLREGERRIDVVARAEAEERSDPEYLSHLNIYTEQGKFVPLHEIATLRESAEESIIWRMNRFPVVTVRADVPDDVRAPDVSMEIDKNLAAIRAKLPEGYRIEAGGAMEDSDKAQDSIIDILPLMGFLIVTLLMLQLKRYSQVTLALLTAPLGIIGVTAALLAFNVPFGFVAMLGMISLSGMIMRNSVILLDQISQDIEAGMSQWDSIVESTVRRFRPIMLTAAAAILAMIPLTHSVFWGPMAVVIMGGLLVATLLTLFYLPALYALWFRVKRPAPTAGE